MLLADSKSGKKYSRLTSDSFQNNLGWNLFGVGDTSNLLTMLDCQPRLVSAPLRCLSWRSLLKQVFSPFIIPLFHVILTIVPFFWSKRCSRHSCKPFAGEESAFQNTAATTDSYFIIFCTSLDLWIYIDDLRSMIIHQLFLNWCLNSIWTTFLQLFKRVSSMMSPQSLSLGPL